MSIRLKRQRELSNRFKIPEPEVEIIFNQDEPVKTTLGNGISKPIVKQNNIKPLEQLLKKPEFLKPKRFVKKNNIKLIL